MSLEAQRIDLRTSLARAWLDFSDEVTCKGAAGRLVRPIDLIRLRLSAVGPPLPFPSTNTYKQAEYRHCFAHIPCSLQDKALTMPSSLSLQDTVAFL